MIQTIRKAWGVPELRKKIVFTLLILLIFRIGNAIPVPYINTTLLGNYLDSMSGTVLGLYNVMSGGAFAEATVFALGVQPYINSSIIIQLLTIAIPALERLARDGGEAGKKKIASITRYATVAIALLQGFGYYMICKNYNILEQQGIWPAVGRKMYGGQASTLPMKVNMSGVLPIIFAQTIASLPATIWAFIGIPEEGTVGRSIYNAIDTKSVLYLIVYFLMIIGFSYFYATIQFNPVEISNNLKRNGGFIPGFRPGKPTSDFIAKVLNKVTLFGAIYLGIVAICPLIAGKLLGNSGLAIGGTSVIIVVGVALETVRALESQMMMRQYKGFLE